MMTYRKKRIGEILVEDGFINQPLLLEAMNESRKKGQRLGTYLAKEGMVPPRAIAIALAKQNRLGYLDLSTHEIPPEVTRYIPEETARKYCLIPIDVMGSTLLIAFADPANLILMDDIRIRTKMEVIPLISLEADIVAAIERLYGRSADAIEEMIKDISEEDLELVDSHPEDVEESLEGVDAAPVIRLVNLIISESIRSGASDIHIEPAERKLRVRYRIDGVLKEMPPPPKKLQNAIISRLKIMSDLDISERRRPQDGRFKIQMEGKNVDFRVSALPTVFGEKIVMRLLDKSNLMLDLKQLGFEDESLQRFTRAIVRPYGLILVTGPTGSGKSTTLYSALSTINDPRKNIITVEDPVEYLLDGINQVQARPDIGFTFAEGLRSILRQDPDVVMIGEIRDLDTAEICIKAALTGHLVFSTLHTNDAPSSVNRLTNMGVEPFLITASLILVVAQRLTRRICPNCKDTYKPEPEILRELGINPDEHRDTVFYQGRGCSRCSGTGYRGRVAIYEVMAMDEELSKCIIQGMPSNDLKREARQRGMLTLRDSGIRKVLAGLTTIEEVLGATFEN